MRKVSTIGQFVKAVTVLYEALPESHALRDWIEDAAKSGNLKDLFFLVNSSDWFKVSGKLKAVCEGAAP